MNSAVEFVKGKHNIGYVDSEFQTRFKDVEFSVRSAPSFQKLPRSMNDATIESELKPGFCELGDIIAFLDNPPEGTKDGNWNLFYTPAFVVRVYWDDGEWCVYAWRRFGYEWRDARRVFSPATVASAIQPSVLKTSDTFELQRAIGVVVMAGYRVIKEQ